MNLVVLFALIGLCFVTVLALYEDRTRFIPEQKQIVLWRGAMVRYYGTLSQIPAHPLLHRVETLEPIDGIESNTTIYVPDQAFYPKPIGVQQLGKLAKLMETI